MATRGQRFELDLDADNFLIKPLDQEEHQSSNLRSIVKEIKEHDSSDITSAPKFRQSKSGFPEHKARHNASSFKQKRDAQKSALERSQIPQNFPSDSAIVHHMGKKYGYDSEAMQKDEISNENKRRIAAMSSNEIEDARAELVKNLNPAFIERLLKRANIEEDLEHSSEEVTQNADSNKDVDAKIQTQASDPDITTQWSSGSQARPVHFPVPPRSAEDFVPLDPHSATFLEDLRIHYFPDTPHDPSSLAWLQDPTAEEDEDSAYNPEKLSYTASSLRFGFNGRLIPPKESLDIEVTKGLHHHGEAPSSAGYTIPELAILSRSTLPNQRCIAYQTLGRILYRLGRGDLGPRGSELQEALWTVVENERVVELMMAVANREGGHVSARAYATEALWLWRKGGGGERGVSKPSQKLAK